MSDGLRTQDIWVAQGADFAIAWPLDTTDDLSTYTAAMQVRPTAASSTVLADLGTALTFDNTAKTLTLTIPASVSAGWTFVSPAGQVYDILITSGSGVKTRVVQGSFYLDAAVTR